jgi:hypothetical protein
VLVAFATMVRLEHVHPLQSGILRLKRPSERRPELPRENPLIFWPRFVCGTLARHVVLAATIVRLVTTGFLISHSPGSRKYMDRALMPVGADDEEEKLDLFTRTTGGSAAVNHVKKIARLTHPGRAI